MANKKLGATLIVTPIIAMILAVVISPKGSPIIPLWILGFISIIVGIIILVVGKKDKKEE